MRFLQGFLWCSRLSGLLGPWQGIFPLEDALPFSSPRLSNGGGPFFPGDFLGEVTHSPSHNEGFVSPIALSSIGVLPISLKIPEGSRAPVDSGGRSSSHRRRSKCLNSSG